MVFLWKKVWIYPRSSCDEKWQLPPQLIWRDETVPARRKMTLIWGRNPVEGLNIF